jgi:hypothetical protein
VYGWISKFQTSGSVARKTRVKTPHKVRTPENIGAVKQSVNQSPMRSARKHALALGLSSRTVRRILHYDLSFHPYKMMVVQQLHHRDYENRVSCCKKISENVPKKDVLITSDEAHFYLSGCVNKQNFRYWSDSNPNILHEKPLHSQRVTVWCAVGQFGVWGPYFFEEEDKSVSVTSERYVRMLSQFLKPKLEELDNNLQVWFQQDGATAHTAKRSLNVLQEMFPEKVVSLRGNVEWPARSPDLSPCDFFLWGYLKAEVFKLRPTSISSLKLAIQAAIEKIPQSMTDRVMQNFRERLQSCIESGGRHLNDVIFKK